MNIPLSELSLVGFRATVNSIDTDILYFHSMEIIVIVLVKELGKSVLFWIIRNKPSKDKMTWIYSS